MKKFLLSILVSLAAVAGFAQDYNENIEVTVNGNVVPPAPAKITVTKNADGTCDFLLKNFYLNDGESNAPVGNINLKGVTMKQAGACSAIETSQTIQLEPGDDDKVDWLGPILPPVPIVLNGKLDNHNLYANIDINLEVMNMIIKVVIGSEDKVTAVKRVEVQTLSNQPVYNLSGVRVAEKFSKALPKGLYVVGGKKMIVK